jgi:hypothetical protein
MKKYIYSPQHQGLVEAPLMTEPKATDDWKYLTELADRWQAYNSWLSSPPIYKVRPEDIEWFSVERGEDEFEVRKQWLREKANQWLDVDMHLPINYYCKTRIVAIPKKGNEPSHYEKMLEEKYLPELSKSGNESKEQSPSIDLDQVVYVPTSVKDETPPFNESVVCLSDGDNLGWFSFPGINSWHVAIDDHTITHWLKKTTIRELIHQPYK